MDERDQNYTKKLVSKHISKGKKLNCQKKKINLEFDIQQNYPSKVK